MRPTVFCLLVLSTFLKASTFTAPLLVRSFQTSHHHRHFPCPWLTLLNANENDNDDVNDNNSSDELQFYRDLQKAKNDKLGAPIPPADLLKDATHKAQDEFLQAMKATRKEFETAKDKLGSEGAVDLFLNKIKNQEAMEEGQLSEDEWQ